jgi:phosphoglycolate phosphatase
MKNKIIIFDMDGVLFDTTAVASSNMRYRFPDITPEMEKELLVGNFHEEVSKLTLPRRPETEEEVSARKLRYAEAKALSLMYAGVKELLVDLKNHGYTIALNTSAYDNNCLPLLVNSNIKDLFDFLGTAEISKSKVEKFKMVQEKYGVEKDDMLFVTDTLGDIRESDIAGIPTIAVTWGAHDKSYFEREEHKNLIKIVDTAEELKNLIFTIFH